jgi:hypothetical protein
MALSPSEELSDQFYSWEKLGRGALYAGYPSELEPRFTPFFGHGVQREIIDDGYRPSVLEQLLQIFSPKRVSNPVTEEIDYKAFEDNEKPLHAIFTVGVSKNYHFKPESIEHFLTIVAMLQSPVSYEIIGQHDRITLQFAVRETVAPFFHTQLLAYFPECTIAESARDVVLELVDASQALYAADFGLREEFMRPMATLNGSHDPYTSTFSTLNILKEGQSVILQLLFAGTVNRWAESIAVSVADGNSGSFFINAPEMPGLAAGKVSRPLMAATLRAFAFADKLQDAHSLIASVSLSIMHASQSESNRLCTIENSEDYGINIRLSDLLLRQTRRTGMLLNTKELATFMHVPNASLSKRLYGGRTATHPAPEALRGNDGYILGYNEHQGQITPVGLSAEQRFRHLHILGSTGVGKSTLMHSLIMQDIENGVGCCVLDPHGDLIEGILRNAPKERIRDIVLIDPSDSNYPLPLNILFASTDHERELLASDLVALFKRFSTSWGDQLHSILANAIMVFLYNAMPGHLGDLRKFLIDKKYRDIYLKTCTEPELVYYWTSEYPLLKTSSIGSIITRLDSFLRPRLIRNMVCQDASLEFPKLIESGKILLVKLSQGLIGEENSHLLGALIVSKLQQSAMARQQQGTASRKPYFCYIDEFHHFIIPSMSVILSGARKFNFGLVLAHQDMQQVTNVDAGVAGSLLSNASTRVCFRLGDTDAKRMGDGFTHFTADDLQNLLVGQAIVRSQTNDEDCNIEVPEWVDSENDYTQEIVDHTRAAYSVVPNIQQGASADDDTDGKSAASPNSPSPNRPPPPQDALILGISAQKIEGENTEAENVVSEDKVKRQPREKFAGTGEKDGRHGEHRYLQAFIKGIGQSHGYVAQVEAKTPDGAGQVDVLLQKAGETIAFEISVTNTVGYEVQNIRKCLDAGYGKVVICCSDEKKLKRIKAKVAEEIRSTSRLMFLTPESIAALFSAAPSGHSYATKKGYRVKIKYENGENVENQEILRGIVSAFKNPSKKP